MTDFTTLPLNICLGIGLSAAVGFRIFVPLFALSIASLAGYVDLSSGFDWIGTVPSLIIFGTATVMEVLGYLIPWVDHALDTIATPLAIIAGTVVTASVLVGIDPTFKWVLSIIAGGGTAGVIQGMSVLTRAFSTGTTGGLGNPVVGTVETVGSTIMSLVSLLVPIVAAAIVIGLLIAIGRKGLRWRSSSSTSE